MQKKGKVEMSQFRYSGLGAFIAIIFLIYQAGQLVGRGTYQAVHDVPFVGSFAGAAGLLALALGVFLLAMRRRMRENEAAK